MFTNEEFKGPTHFSHQISFQDGDQSANSNFNESFLEPKITQKDDLQIDGMRQNSAFLKFIDVFTPYNKFIAFWDLFQIFTYLLIYFWLPYAIFFIFVQTKKKLLKQRKIFFRKEKEFHQNSLIALNQIAKCAEHLNQDLLKHPQNNDSHFDEYDEEQIEENYYNSKSVQESLLFNIEQSDLQNQKVRNKQKIMIIPQGQEKVVEKDSNSGNIQKSCSSSIDDISIDLMQPQSPKIIPTQLKISILNSRKLQQISEKRKSHRQSQDIERSSLINCLKKSDFENIPNILKSFQKKKTMQTNNQTFIGNQLDVMETNYMILQDFEKMQKFSYYSPFYNMDGVIDIAKYKEFNRRKLFPEFSLDSFSWAAIKKGWKLRKLSQQSKSSRTTQQKELNISQRIFFAQEIN